MVAAAELMEAADAWSTACPDWADRLRAGRPPIPDLPLDTEAAEKAVAIFNVLRLPDVAGQPALAEAAGEWFRDLIRAAFGSIDPETGSRRIGEIFAMVPKKSAKTTYSAALALVALLRNRVPNVEMLFVGPTQQIAQLCFSQAVGMIEADPVGHLQKRFHVDSNRQSITDKRRETKGARLAIKSFDTKVLTGTRPVLVILDELHEMATMAKAEWVMAQLRGGQVFSPQSLFIMITTQSDKVPAGVFKTELDYARDVRDGRKRSARGLLPMLYEFPEDIQRGEGKPWRDPALWPMVMPNLGRSVQIERLIGAHQEARDKGVEAEALWASQHLNVEIGMALHTDRWVGTDYWPAARQEGLDLEAILTSSDVVTVGVDGGGLDDLLGLAVLGRHRVSRVWQLWVRAWAQPEALERRAEIAPRLRGFAAEGDLVICGAPRQDVSELADIVERVHGMGLLPAEHGVGLDPYGIAAIVDELAERGIPDGALVAVGQGTRLSPSVWGLERKLKDGSFRHGGQALMDWCVSNARTEQRGNAVLITKQTAGKAKIDPLIATFNAAMLMARNPGAARRIAVPADYRVTA